MIYARNNAAKQWILEELDRRFGQTTVRILDLACGEAGVWQTYLSEHAGTSVVGIDTDTKAILSGQKKYVETQRIELQVLDAQKPVQDTFEAVVALCAIEHVVDRPAFLRTVWSTLKNGGVAYLNYDAGHFRSHDLKERLMIPVSQLLARVGVEGPYMKRVDDKMFRAQAEALGFRVLDLKKHNLASLKGLMKGANDEAIREWFDHETRLNAQFRHEQLDPWMLSTTLILQKP